MGPSSRSPRSWLGLLVLFVAFAVPLMLGLGEPEMRSDEAIYSYAVERILDTGEWLTPRSIPSDEAFLEKPPLKFWLVAGGMTTGLLPPNEAGMRRIDGLFGAIAFLYIFLIGRRLAGTACGLVAVLTLFTFEPLLYDHGLRSNNMEASVFLCYCGGVYHFIRWAEATRGAGRWQAIAVAAFFTLGFMTKFVAALFLPLILVAALAARPDRWQQVRERWTDWLLPIAFAVALTTPWFVYESRTAGPRFWQIIFGTHVYQRFAGTLDPNHVHPWHHYFTAAWHEIARAGVQILTAAGLLRLAWLAARRESGSWLPRLVLIWGVLPVALISLGTSKLLHYAYPFLPALGLAAGAAFAWVLDQMREQPGFRNPSSEPGVVMVWLRRAMVVIGIAMIAVAIWTLASGPIRIERDGLVIFRNASPVRPVLYALALFWIAWSGRSFARLAAAVCLVWLLPVTAYADRLHQIGHVDHPLRAARDCIQAVRASGAAVGSGVMSGSGNVLHHSYYYYLWRTGPWVIAPAFDLESVRVRLTTPGSQTPVILSRADFDTLASRAPALGDVLTTGAVRDDDENVMLLPGPFASCARSIIDAGGKPLF